MSDETRGNERRRINEAAAEMVAAITGASTPPIGRIWKERQLTDVEAKSAIARAHIQIAARTCSDLYGFNVDYFAERLNEFIKAEVATARRLRSNTKPRM